MTTLYYQNILPAAGSVTSVSSEQADRPAKSVIVESTKLIWMAGVKTSPAQITLDIGAAGNYYIGVANLYRPTGVAVTLESASDADFTADYTSENVTSDPFIVYKAGVRYLRVAFTKEGGFADYPFLGLIFAFTSKLDLSRDFILPLTRGFDSKSAAEISASGVFSGRQYYTLRTFKLSFRGLSDTDISGITSVFSVSGIVRPLYLQAPVIGGFICRLKEPPALPLLYHADSAGYSEAELSLIEV
jgi:hypothetical protein